MFSSRLPLVFLSAILPCAIPGAYGDEPSERERIEELVKQLGSDKAALREEASAHLYTLGQKALKALEGAESSDDAEVSRRAKRLILDISYRLSRNAHLTSAEFTQDGSRVLLASSGMGTAFIWLRDLDRERDILYLRGHPERMGKLALSIDGRRALIPGFQTDSDIAAIEDYSVQLWSLDERKLLRRMEGHRLPVYSIVFSPDEKQALSCSSDKTLRLWDLATGKEVRRFEGHASNVFRAIFSSDGSRILSCGMDGTMRLWDTQTAKEIRSFELGSYVNTIAISSDGKRALSTTGVRVGQTPETSEFKDLTMKLWDLSTGKELQSFTGHGDMITQLAFAPNGKHALSCAFDHTVRLWDLGNGREVACFRTKDKRVMTATFIKGGSCIIAACSDATIESWDVPAK